MKRNQVMVLALLAAACGSPERSETGASAERVVGGTPTDAYDDVVVVFTESSLIACSGVLIADDLVLTVATCFPAEFSELEGCATFVAQEPPATDVVVWFGANVNDGSEVLEVEVLDYAVPEPPPCHNNLALVRLAEPVDPAVATPRSVRTDPVVGGEPIRVVGFGATVLEDPWGFGEKAVAQGTVSCAEPACLGGADPSPAIFLSDDLILGSGDAGAPALDADGLIIGLGGFSTETGESGFTDLTRFAALFAPPVGEEPEPADPAAQTLQLEQHDGCTVTRSPRSTPASVIALAIALLALRRRRGA